MRTCVSRHRVADVLYGVAPTPVKPEPLVSNGVICKVAQNKAGPIGDVRIVLVNAPRTHDHTHLL